MAMSASTTPSRSILEKPLNQLTEEDISQLTREDCRKYLKDKGMRRPSWNKSQAIQQVISLKALLEPCDDSGASVFRKVVVSPRVTSNSDDLAKEPSDDADVAVSAEEPVPNGSLEPLNPASDEPTADPDHNKDSGPRSQGAGDELLEQMTIFYCGKVNVYHGVPPDKARTILHLAASPIHLPKDDHAGNATVWPFSCRLQSANERDGPFPPSPLFRHSMQSETMIGYSQQLGDKDHRNTDVEGQANRKVSLLRYLEKRKDRGKLKSKRTTSLTPSLEVYLNHNVGTQASNCSVSQSGSPQQDFARPADNEPRIAHVPVDPNIKDLHEF